MDKKQFQGLIVGVRQMGKSMHGKLVTGTKVTKVSAIEPRKIRVAADLSKSNFC